MSAFTVGKCRDNPAGEPLGRAARRMRLDLEGQMVSSGPAEDGLALQAVGLLLQLEGVDREMRGRETLHAVGDGTVTAIALQPARRSGLP